MKAPVVSVLFLLAAFGAGCRRPAETVTVATPPTPVRVAEAGVSTQALPVRVTGLLQRRAEADLSFKVGGVVRDVRVRVGDTVRRGEILAALSTEEIDAQVALARTARAKALRDQQRAQALQDEKVATLADLQDATSALEAADAQLRIAEFNQRFSVITAPADGRILRRLVEPNELVPAGKAIIGFADDSAGWLVKAGLPETAGGVAVGDLAEVIDLGSRHALARGTLAQISESTEPATRTIPIEVALQSGPAGLRSGSVVEVRLQPADVPPRPVVPASALIEGAQKRASLFLVERDAAGGSVARRLEVEVEALSGELAYLRTALPAGARVVVTGAEYLRDQAPVAPQP